MPESARNIPRTAKVHPGARSCKVNERHGQAYQDRAWCVEVPGGSVVRFRFEEDAREFAERVDAG